MSTTYAKREAFKRFVRERTLSPLMLEGWNRVDAEEAHNAGFQAGRAQALREMSERPAVAWLYVPSDVWNSAVVTMVKDHADEARKIGREVTALIPRPKPTAPEGGKP